MFLPAHPFDDDKLREECGVFGEIGEGCDPARLAAVDARNPAHHRPVIRLSQNCVALRRSLVCTAANPATLQSGETL